MTTRDIRDQIKDLGTYISAELVSKITQKIMPRVLDWQNRPLDSMYTFLFIDAIHYRVREDNQVITKAEYVALYYFQVKV